MNRELKLGIVSTSPRFSINLDDEQGDRGVAPGRVQLRGKAADERQVCYGPGEVRVAAAGEAEREEHLE